MEHEYEVVVETPYLYTDDPIVTLKVTANNVDEAEEKARRLACHGVSAGTIRSIHRLC